MSSKLMSESSRAAYFSAAWLTAPNSASVHFVFLVSSEVICFSPAGRDDTDDFFAMSVLPLFVYGQKNDDDPGTNVRGANGVPALLSSWVYAVREDQAIWILEQVRKSNYWFAPAASGSG